MDTNYDLVIFTPKSKQECINIFKEKIEVKGIEKIMVITGCGGIHRYFGYFGEIKGDKFTVMRYYRLSFLLRSYEFFKGKFVGYGSGTRIYIRFIKIPLYTGIVITLLSIFIMLYYIYKGNLLVALMVFILLFIGILEILEFRKSKKDLELFIRNNFC